MDIVDQRHGAVTVLRPVGPLLGPDCHQLLERVRGAISASLGRFVLDASAMPFVDSDGLEALADISDELAETGQPLRLCGVGETLREVFELTELTELFEYYADVGDATRSFL